MKTMLIITAITLISTALTATLIQSVNIQPATIQVTGAIG